MPCKGTWGGIGMPWKDELAGICGKTCPCKGGRCCLVSTCPVWDVEGESSLRKRKSGMIVVCQMLDYGKLPHNGDDERGKAPKRRLHFLFQPKLNCGVWQTVEEMVLVGRSYAWQSVVRKSCYASFVRVAELLKERGWVKQRVLYWAEHEQLRE